MAAWQFDLELVPNRPGSSLADEDAGIACAWLVAKVGHAWTMLPGWTVYGLEAGNRVDVLVDDGQYELSVRIDARSSADEFISSVVALAVALKCTFHAPELGRDVEPSYREVVQALQQSGAWRFALDPRSAIGAG